MVAGHRTGRAARVRTPRSQFVRFVPQSPLLLVDPRVGPRRMRAQPGSAAVTGTRLTLAIVLGIGLAAPVLGIGDGKGFFHRKTMLDPARVRQLVETARSDPDEKKRKVAVAELLEADPRLQLDVIPTLIAALRRDTSPAVRAAAAEVIGPYGVVFPTAGLALEDAIESDPAVAVRNAAKQALWEYHLVGYHSAKGA